MKKLILLSAIALLGFASCKKENIELEKPYNVKYEVEADYILVYFKDNVWNGENKQYTVVNGRWTYEYNATKIDTAFLSVYAGALSPEQRVKASIKVDGKTVKSIDRIFGSMPDYHSNDTLIYKIR